MNIGSKNENGIALLTGKSMNDFSIHLLSILSSVMSISIYDEFLIYKLYALRAVRTFCGITQDKLRISKIITHSMGTLYR